MVTARTAVSAKRGGNAARSHVRVVMQFSWGEWRPALCSIGLRGGAVKECRPTEAIENIGLDRLSGLERPGPGELFHKPGYTDGRFWWASAPQGTAARRSRPALRLLTGGPWPRTFAHSSVR